MLRPQVVAWPESIWANPFHVGKDGDRDQVCDAHAAYLAKKPELLAQIGELKGKVLGCWCAPERCQGDHLPSWPLTKPDRQNDVESAMKFTGEQLLMGRLIEVGPGHHCRVWLDDERELVVRVTEHTNGLYNLVPGERVCVSIDRNNEPMLTSYLN